MRWCCVLTVVAALLCAACRAEAAVVVNVDIGSQTMSVAVNGETRHNWAISTGRQGYVTPNGSYRPQRLARHWYSRKYGGAMPYSVFFHKGWAIHGTTEVRRLGRPASHGCIRHHPKNAAVLFGLVQQAGSTRIVISGSRPTSPADAAPLRRQARRAGPAGWRQLAATSSMPSNLAPQRHYTPPRANALPHRWTRPGAYRPPRHFVPLSGDGPRGIIVLDPGD